MSDADGGLICVIGDCLLDITVAPFGPMRQAHDLPAHIEVGPGGQGANVAVRLARRGARVRLVAALADDTAGRLLRARLAEESVDLASLLAERTGIVVALLGRDGERSMLSDRVPLDGNLAAALGGADWVHISGYVLRDPAEAGRVVEAVREGGARGLSISGGSFPGSRDGAIARAAMATLDPGLVVVNRDEGRLLSGGRPRSAAEIAESLASSKRLAIVTDGRRGSVGAGGALEEPTVVHVPVPDEVAVDTTGAGDAYTAALVARLVPGWPPTAEGIVAAMHEASVAGAAATAEYGSQARVAEELGPETGGSARGD